VDAVSVVLEVEVELAIGIAERVGIDAPAEVELADDRFGIAVDERAERTRGGGDPDALRILPRVAGGIIKQIFVAELEHFGRPGEPLFRPAAELRQSVERLARPRRIAREPPMDEIVRYGDRDIHSIVRGIGDELRPVRKHEGVREILLEHGDEGRLRRGRNAQQGGSDEREASGNYANGHLHLLKP
jgi:hypothetical protein